MWTREEFFINMFSQNLQYLLLIIVICVGTAEITIGPQNKAVKKGENVTLDCWVEITEDKEVVIWNFYKAKEYWMTYDPNVTKVFQDEPRFIEDGYGIAINIFPGLRRYRLIVQKASRNHAGKYACVLEKENRPTTQEAELMVVDPLTCTPEQDEIEIDVGQTVTFVGGILYFGKYSPRLTVWRAGGGNSSIYGLSAGMPYSYTVYVTATAALDGCANVYTVSFDHLTDGNLHIDPDKQLVGNVPVYYDECGTVLRVNKYVYMRILHNWKVERWGVIEVQFGDNISCVATELSIARNISNVWFTEDKSTEVIDGQEMTIGERHVGMHTYSCQMQFADDEIVHKNFTFYLPAERPTDMLILRNMYVVEDVFDVDVEVGDNITCTARGRPEPTFSISNDFDQTDVIDGNVMSIEERHVARIGHSYTCYAQNSDGTQIYKNWKTFRINGLVERSTVSAGYQELSSTLSIIMIALFASLLQHKMSTISCEEDIEARLHYPPPGYRPICSVSPTCSCRTYTLVRRQQLADVAIVVRT